MELILNISMKWNLKKDMCIPAQSSNFLEIMVWNPTLHQERSKLLPGELTTNWKLSPKILSFLISKDLSKWQYKWVLLSSHDHPKISEVDL